MVTPTPKRIKNGAAGLNYILKEAAHYGEGPRNQYLSYVNMVEGVSFEKQFQYFWNRASDEHQVQMRHFIISFSDRELNANRSEDIQFAHENSTEYFKETFPNRQMLIATQIDGKSHLIHCHAMISDCDILDSKGFTEQERSRTFFRKTATDFFKKKFKENDIKYDYGRNHDPITYSQFERVFSEKAKRFMELQNVIDEEVFSDHPNQDKIAKLKVEQKDYKYVWKEHLKSKIQEAKEHSVSYDDFVEKLSDYGVKYIDSGKHNKFELFEKEYKKYTLKPFPKKSVCRGKTLSPDFSRDALKNYFYSLTKERIDEINSLNISDEYDESDI
ncbi:MAG: relaxase/mobilization nuclease domain-containing protein, partial [Treponema sp.]|nr:relaxase/mobilization nuclease domain-containing protein [Treponema sp.]